MRFVKIPLIHIGLAIVKRHLVPPLPQVLSGGKVESEKWI